MTTYRVTQLVKDFRVFYVDTAHWQEAKQQVEDGLIEPHHTDVADEVEVIFVDSEDGKVAYYEEGEEYEESEDEEDKEYCDRCLQEVQYCGCEAGPLHGDEIVTDEE